MKKKICLYLLLFCSLFFGIDNVLANETKKSVYWNIAGQSIGKDNVKKIVFNDISSTNNIITEYDWSKDVSSDRLLREGDKPNKEATYKKGTVMEYIVGDTLYIQYDGILYFNTDCSWLFSGMSDLETIEGLEYVNTSQVIDMFMMFLDAISLKSIDLSSFDTSNVVQMSGMFQNAKSLEYINLKGIDTSNVKEMNSMFYGTTSLKSIDLSTLDTSNVTTMPDMFRKTGLINLDLSNFDTSNVVNMFGLFEESEYLESINLSSFDTSNVIKMQWMFYNNKSLKSIDLSSFNTSKVENFYRMFEGTSSLKELDLSNFNTSNVTNMGNMFYKASSLETLDLSNFDTSNVIEIAGMFGETTSLKNLNLSSFNTTKIKNMDNMFYKAASLEVLDLSSFDTSKVTSMQHMFSKANSLRTIYVSKNWTTDNLSDYAVLFREDILLTGSNGTVYSVKNKDKEYARIDTEDAPGYLTLKKNLKLNLNTLFLQEAKNNTLVVTYDNGEIVDNNNLTWTTSDEFVASVNNGIITGINKGTATITVTNGMSYATIKVTVGDYVKGDLNGNGKIDLSDIILLLKRYLGTEITTENDIEIGDIDSNKKIEINDIILLLRIYLKTN